MDIDSLAFERFSINKIKSLQRLVIENILASEREDGKRKQIILFPTGGGKSLCFLLPALFLKGLTIVIYPLLSLMADQKRRMDDAGISSCVINGKTSNEEIDSYFSAIKAGKIKIAIVNPEIIIKRNLIPRFKECNISHIAIDEAHCVTSWGNSFRPAYLKLSHFVKELNANCVSAFTATAPDYILQDIKSLLFDNEAFIIKGDGDRENLFYSVIKTSSKKDFLLDLCKTEAKPLIVFCNTRNNAEDTAKEI
nr:DEAD/DEAH box helicase [Treponema sp.]